MPSLVLFGHRTVVAGDDLQLLCLLYICLRVMQIVVAFYLLAFSTRERNKLAEGTIGRCDETSDEATDELHNLVASSFLALSWAYTICSLILSGIFIITDVSVWRLSDKGTPTQPEKRKALVPLCKFKIFFLGTVRAGVIVIGILLGLRISAYCDCRQNFDSGLLPDGGPTFEDKLTGKTGCQHAITVYACFFLLLFSQMCEALCPVVAALFSLFREGQMRRASHKRKLGHTGEQKWRVCCFCCFNCTNIFTCCLCGGGEVDRGGYRDISRTLATYFDDGGKLDIVTSDIVAGLVMLLRLQRQRRIECQNSLVLKRQTNNEVDDDEYKEEEIDGPRDDVEHQMSDVGIQESMVELVSKRQTNDVDGEYREEETDGRRDDVVHRMSEIAINERMVELGDRTAGTRHHLSQSLVYRVHLSETDLHYDAALRRTLSSQNSVDISAMAEGARFCKLALGVYGWMLYVYKRPCTGCCRLAGIWCSGVIHSRPCCNKRERVVGDNLCGWHSILSRGKFFAGVDIAYAHFGQGFEQTPYCIAIDHEWKSVVLVIRGTMSLDDAVVDLTISPVHLESLGSRCGFNGDGEYAHNGMLACCEWIYNDIQRHGMLQKTMESAECAGYRLRVVGHSLGAGCAAILGLMLRKQYPNLRCLCFSPPGCVFSERTANACKDYITSYVVGDDMVPRLSLQSMEYLRNEILDLIARIKVPKHQVLSVFGNRERDVDDLLHQRCPESEFSKQVDEFHAVQSTRKTESALPEVLLYPPGKIVHLFRIQEQVTCMHGLCHCLTCGVAKKENEFLARWTATDDFQEITISPNMGSDHMPVNVCVQLERIAESFGLQAPYFGHECFDEGVPEQPRDENTIIAAQSHSVKKRS